MKRVFLKILNVIIGNNFSQDIIAFSEPGNTTAGRKRHLELAELVEILARLLVMRKSDTQLAFCCSGNRD
ncbi:hypothetical protein NQ317_017946 [Molorchus minor]|uniref:Uncharacterized protein n=1 Tax=Molorchus minor TaxID=1323400 RepID=A0ABQ9JG28_9CUCU|nr:hypothetical protein NQ317_017946 [Molorchus minor]